MRIPIETYNTFVFDCDGVVLDSNSIKTEAFRTAALAWGQAPAAALVAHHVDHGGVSRYSKFKHFLEHILPEYMPTAVPDCDGPGLDDLLSAYAAAVRAGLKSCAVAEGLAELRAATAGTRWLIVSGGDQSELREIFSERGLADYFDGGIFGSPDNKDDILARELERKNIVKPALFLGDSRYDFEAARRAGIHFALVAEWSEWSERDEYLKKHAFAKVERLGELVAI